MENDTFKYVKGVLYNKYYRSPNSLEGQEAGYTNSKGYKVVRLDGAKVLAHRVIWEMFNGPIPKDMFIDHINRDPGDNRIRNLRLVTRQENQFNTSALGVHGVASGKYVSQIQVDKTKIYLGRFNTQEEARNAYIEAKKRFHVIQEDETVLKELEKEVDKSQ